MEKFKGTKGKWINNYNEHGFITSVRSEDSGKIIFTSKVNNEEESNSNMVLGSCAPEMLEMLEETFLLTDKLQMPTEFEISQLRNKLFNLIKKATCTDK